MNDPAVISYSLRRANTHNEALDVDEDKEIGSPQTSAEERRACLGLNQGLWWIDEMMEDGLQEIEQQFENRVQDHIGDDPFSQVFRGCRSPGQDIFQIERQCWSPSLLGGRSRFFQGGQQRKLGRPSPKQKGARSSEGEKASARLWQHLACASYGETIRGCEEAEQQGQHVIAASLAFECPTLATQLGSQAASDAGKLLANPSLPGPIAGLGVPVGPKQDVCPKEPVFKSSFPTVNLKHMEIPERMRVIRLCLSSEEYRARHTCSSQPCTSLECVEEVLGTRGCRYSGTLLEARVEPCEHGAGMVLLEYGRRFGEWGMWNCPWVSIMEAYRQNHRGDQTFPGKRLVLHYKPGTQHLTWTAEDVALAEIFAARKAVVESIDKHASQVQGQSGKLNDKRAG